jgi:hypothetical protein
MISRSNKATTSVAFTLPPQKRMIAMLFPRNDMFPCNPKPQRLKCRRNIHSLALDVKSDIMAKLDHNYSRRLHDNMHDSGLTDDQYRDASEIPVKALDLSRLSMYIASLQNKVRSLNRRLNAHRNPPD